MTQEDKELLLKDLCARLPYNPLVEYKGESYNVLGIAHGRLVLCKPFMSYTLKENPLVEEVKTYLFPLSRLNSLTDEQKKTLKVLCDWNDEEADAQSILVLYQKHFVMKSDVIDWLHKNHFDYRGLIEKGLAIDATGLNIY